MAQNVSARRFIRNWITRSHWSTPSYTIFWIQSLHLLNIGRPRWESVSIRNVPIDWFIENPMESVFAARQIPLRKYTIKGKYFHFCFTPSSCHDCVLTANIIRWKWNTVQTFTVFIFNSKLDHHFSQVTIGSQIFWFLKFFFPPVTVSKTLSRCWLQIWKLSMRTTVLCIFFIQHFMPGRSYCKFRCFTGKVGKQEQSFIALLDRS